MEPFPPSEDASSEKTVFSLRVIVTLVALGLMTTMVLGIGVYVAFDYIRRNIESTPNTLPTLTEEPIYNKIAYIGDDNNVWLVAPDGKNPRSLTENGHNYRFPTWSPDGRRLAFIGFDNQNNQALYVSPASRQATELLFSIPGSAPFYLYWAPDSSAVTFLTQETSGLAMRISNVFDPDQTRILGQGAPFYWAWSPQSDKLLLHVGGSRRTSLDAHISVIDNNMIDAERVELKLAPGNFQAPVWSSSGDAFYYIAVNETGREAIYKTNVNTLEQDVVAPLGGFAHIVLSPSDQQMAYLQYDQGARPPFGNAYLVDVDGNNQKLIVENPVVSMYWSPDGKKLALLSVSNPLDGPTARVDGLAAPLSQEFMLRWWLYDTETETVEPIISFVPTNAFLQTVPFFDQYHLSLTFWSPDSRYLVVTKGNNNGQTGTVWVVDTTDQQEPLQVAEGTLAVWSWQ